MNREFLKFYNQELAILREQAAEFAEDYPGIAERLGGLVGDAADPMISGLLEGAAFLAARVQLKLKHEFADFTTNLIDQLAPHYLAPTPSFVLVRAKPKFGDPGAARRAEPSPRAPCSTRPIARRSATSPAGSRSRSRSRSGPSISSRRSI